MYVYLFLVCIAAILVALLLTLVVEPIARMLGQKPLWFELIVCLSLPFLSGVLIGACGSGGPGPDVGAGIRIAIGFAVGFVGAVSLLLGRWFPRTVVVALIVLASAAGFLVEYVNVAGPVQNLAQVITPKQTIISLTFILICLGTTIAVWRLRDRKNSH